MSGPKEEVIRPAIKKPAIFDRTCVYEGQRRGNNRSSSSSSSVAVRADRFINAYWKQVGRYRKRSFATRKRKAAVDDSGPRPAQFLLRLLLLFFFLIFYFFISLFSSLAHHPRSPPVYALCYSLRWFGLSGSFDGAQHAALAEICRAL